MRLTPEEILACHRERAARKFHNFVDMGWPVIDTETYRHNWHMDAIADHLQAIADGQIKRLLINIPPGTSKSSLTSVFFPAWLWGPGGKPHWRVISASHEGTLATRDNLRSRRLITSGWYQTLWPIRLTSDQNEKTYFENERMGFRQASSVGGMTGKRGHLVIWDDPLSAEAANSEIEREKAIRRLTETLPTRMIDPTTSAIVIIMQRLHEADVSGHILEHDLGYEHLMIPMEFEPERKCRTSIGWEDPRTEEGELLDPVRFPAHVIEADKRTMGSYAIAGQYQQRPVPRGGGFIKRHWFEIVDAAPADCRWARGWDFAGTKDASAAWTRGCRIGRSRSSRVFYIDDMVGVQGSPFDVKRLLLQTAQTDGRQVYGSIPQDPGQAGKAQVADLLSELAGYNYHASPETGDKMTRAEPLAAQAEAGNVKLVNGPWVKGFLDEVEAFPTGKWSDQVDAASRAFAALVMEPEHKTGTVRMKL